MVRPLRIEYLGAWYHVACRGNRRLKIFGDDKDRLRFLKALKESVEAFNVVVHGYVILDNHFLCGAQHKKWLCAINNYVK